MIYRDKNITILGGGTAGWLTSLYCKKIFPHNNITLIESKRIGILGAGEGSTPNVDDYVYAHKLALNNKIDLNNCSYALHFDASKTAEYLKDLAIKKGVNHHYGELKTIESDKDENITKLIFEDNYTKNCDFVMFSS